MREVSKRINIGFNHPWKIKKRIKTEKQVRQNDFVIDRIIESYEIHQLY